MKVVVSVLARCCMSELNAACGPAPCRGILGLSMSHDLGMWGSSGSVLGTCESVPNLVCTVSSRTPRALVLPRTYMAPRAPTFGPSLTPCRLALLGTSALIGS